MVVETQGHSGGIALLWRFQNEVTLRTFNKNHIDVFVKNKDGDEFRLTGVYGEPDRQKRKETWDMIRMLSSINTDPWCLIGDMNNVLSQADKQGGRPYPQWLIQGFRDVIEDCSLTDLDLDGYPFTWERGAGTGDWIEVRLDRALVSTSFLNIFPNVKLINLEVSTSDHCPILLEIHKASIVIQKRVFRFENAWLREPMCQKIVEDVWSSGASVSFYAKIKECSEILSSRGREITGSFKNRINQCKKTIKLLKGRRDSNSIAVLKEEQKKLSEIYTQQEVFWRQRSKQLWLREGDQNSKYFHASGKNRCSINQIRSLRNNEGQEVDWNSGMENVITEYFSTLFKASVTEWSEVVQGMNNKVTAEQNEFLLSPVTEIEVKRALFHMHPDKSPGPDGMTPGFYQKYWGVVSKDVVSVVRRFFDTEIVDEQLVHTNIALIPKKKNPQVMTDIRPISLCNVIYKVISKVLANRLKSIIDFVISDNQSAFIPGRLITDNVMIAHELMHFMKRKSTGKQGWMALKVDMSKAYDRVEWGFLAAVLARLGFDPKVIRLYMACISSVTYQIAHAGRVFGSITPSRGIRQGDPLSSYLFLICIEGLTSFIQRYESRGMIKGIKVARTAPSVTHMLFADDCYIFCKANVDCAKQVQTMLSVFERASGQQVNIDKSSVIFSRNVCASLKEDFRYQLGFREASENSTYLGIPCFLHRKKTAVFGYIKERLQDRL
ncbi:hypothetical protein AgCh_013389 [Apium graveolens]